MNVWKKVIVLITAALVVLRVLTVNSYAIAGPVVVGSTELETLLIESLLSTGQHSRSDLEGLGIDELQSMYQDDINNGYISGSAPLLNPTTQTQKSWFDEAYYYLNNTYASDFGAWLYDNTHPTTIDPGFNVPAGGCVVKNVTVTGTYFLYYCNEPGIMYDSGGVMQPSESSIYYECYNYDGTIAYTGTCAASSFIKDKNTFFYGCWVGSDGLPAETDDESAYYVGEADGVPITPDMIDSNGNVTVNGTTYTPSKYVNPDALTDEALLELLREILNAIDSTPVVDTSDNTLADDIANDVAVELEAADLNNFVVPTGITSVFPFCLPFDFVRGLQLLATEPVAPVFEIPFNIPSFGSFEGSENTVTLDMAKYSKYFEVARWVQVILFSMALIFISRKLVQGVH